MTAVMGTDSGRAAVYAAENQVHALMDFDPDGVAAVRFEGSTLPPIEQDKKFADVDSIQRYVDMIHGANWGYGTAEGVPPVKVRDRKGSRKAEWESPDTIAIPVTAPGGKWACREMVVLHEYAHHAVFHLYGLSGHGERFRAIHTDLVRNAVGPVAGLLLLAFYGKAQR